MEEKWRWQGHSSDKGVRKDIWRKRRMIRRRVKDDYKSFAARPIYRQTAIGAINRRPNFSKRHGAGRAWPIFHPPMSSPFGQILHLSPKVSGVVLTLYG